MNLADRVYLARYYEIDGPTKMGSLFGRDRKHIAVLIGIMKENGEYERYRNLTEEQYEKIQENAEEEKVND
ncbi:hypothetical protein D3C76_336000 [compost metagenome]